MDFEDLRVGCLNVLSQHSHGENKEKYCKPLSGYLMTQLYCQGVKVTMHHSIVSGYTMCGLPPCPYTPQKHDV
jgi:hypothetical protein